MSLFRRPIFSGANQFSPGKPAKPAPPPKPYKGPLYQNAGYGDLNPGVLFWNCWQDACTDNNGLVPANTGDSVGSLPDRTGHNRLIILGNNPKPTKGATCLTGQSIQGQLGGPNATSVINSIRTVIVSGKGLYIPMYFYGGYNWKFARDYYQGWYEGAQYPSFIYQYPAGNNPDGYTPAQQNNVYIIQQRPNTANQFIDAWVNGKQVLAGIPVAPPPNGNYAGDWYSFQSTNQINPTLFYECVGLNYEVFPSDMGTYFSWFAARAGVTLT